MNIEELIYEIEENAYVYHLRLNLEWNDILFMKEINLINQSINKYKNEKVIPKILIYYFCKEIDNIIGIISHPAFYSNVNIVEQELIEGRKKMLIEMKERFFSGDFYTYW